MEARIAKVVKDNWIGKVVKIDSRKYEVVDESKDKLQVIEYGKYSSKWVLKSEVRL